MIMMRMIEDDDEQGFDDEDEYLDDEDIEVVAYMHIWRICTLGLCLKMVLSVLMTAPDNSYNGHTGQFFSYKWNVRFTALCWDRALVTAILESCNAVCCLLATSDVSKLAASYCNLPF